MENLKTTIKGLCFEDLTREDIASRNFTIATLAYAAYFGKRRLDMEPCYRHPENERAEIFNEYKEEIEKFLHTSLCSKGFDSHTYEVRKAQLRGVWSGLDRKGTAVDDMPIFKHIDGRRAVIQKAIKEGRFAAA